MMRGRTDKSTFENQSTLSLLNFENVRTGGIIETASTYTMIVEIEPREWLTLSEERRSNLYIAYLTYLRGLQFPTQLFTLTTPFDARQYCAKFDGPLSSKESFTPAPEYSDEHGTESATEGKRVASDGGTTASRDILADSPLLEYGRLAHAEWMDQILTLGDVRDRRFFVAVSVNKGAEEADRPSRLSAWRAKVPVGGRHVKRVQNETPYLDEVWARAQRVASQLPRTQVGTNILDSREAVLDVLYQYYRGQESPVSFEHAAITKPREDVLTDPQTGDTHDLETVFTEADHEAHAAGTDAIPPRPEKAELPFAGRVQDDYVTRVTKSRLLQWHARNISPIGTGPQYTSPRSVYLGVGLFLLGLLCGIGAFGVFLATGQGEINATSYWQIRELALGLAAVSVPIFLLSLTILLPARTAVRVLGLIGMIITGLATILFVDAYPLAWDTADMSRTSAVLAVYGLGVLILTIAVACALRARRSVLADFETDSLSSDTAAVSDTSSGVELPRDE